MSIYSHARMSEGNIYLMHVYCTCTNALYIFYTSYNLLRERKREFLLLFLMGIMSAAEMEWEPPWDSAVTTRHAQVDTPSMDPFLPPGFLPSSPFCPG